MSTDVVKDEKIDVNGQPNENQNRGENRRGFGGRGGGRFNGNVRKQENKGGDGPEQQQQQQQQGGGDRGPGGGGRPFGGGRGGGGGGGGGRFNRNRGGGGGLGHDLGPRGGNDIVFLNDRLQKLVGGSTVDLPPQDYIEKKFNGRCRLYVGNLPGDFTEDEFKELFTPYGETSEMYINKEKNFAFIRLDYRSSAEKAKRELDGSAVKNRNIRVRFASIGSTVKVKNLTPYVTSELLDRAFSVFGEVERASVSVDDRGNSLKEGVVEFARKSGAQSALRHCSEGCMFLTNSLKPVILEPFEISEDNFSERSISKKGADFFEARETGPKFAKPGSFEFEFGTRWKQIHELYKQKEEALKKEMKLEEEKLEAQLQYAKYEHETEMLREQLRQRELDRERQKREWELKQRQAEEQKLEEEEGLRRQQEEMSRRMLHQEDELRRRQQENNLFMQTQQISSLMDTPLEGRSSSAFGTGVKTESAGRDYDASTPFQYEGQRAGETSFLDVSYNRNRYEGAGGRSEMEEMASRRPGGGRWAHQERRGQTEEFPSKRRRF